MTQPFEPIERPASRRRRRLWRRGRAGRAALWCGTALVGLFLLAPIIVVLVFSTNSERSLHSYGHFSLRWFSAALHNSNLTASMVESLKIAAITAVAATLLGSLLAFGISRSRTRWAKVPNAVLVATLVTPEIATAISVFIIFTYGLHIDLSIWTVVAAHTTFSIVYVTLVVRTRIAGLRGDVEEAARDLGCTELQALRLVVLPPLAPAIVGSALLVFVLSFDDFVTSMFTTGTGTSPLPVYIYSLLKFGLSPEINAVGTFMLVVSLGIGAVGILLMRGASLRSSRRFRRA